MFFFTAEKYQFLSHLICIEFTACDKINGNISLLDVTSCDNTCSYLKYSIETNLVLLM